MKENFILSVTLKNDKNIDFTKYPFNIPIIKKLKNIEVKFSSRITFLVGENGSGKSTFIEALAISQGFNPEGGSRNFNFHTNNSHSKLYKYLKVIRSSRKLEDGFFLRAESFYNLATNIDELESYKKGLIKYYGEKSLHRQSHGESFFSLIQNRFKKNGLFILDEPESALSPQKQMAMMIIMNNLVAQGSQFIVSTHSPILLSFPNALIYEINDGWNRTLYENTELYTMSKYFLNNYKKILSNMGILEK